MTYSVLLIYLGCFHGLDFLGSNSNEVDATGKSEDGKQGDRDDVVGSS